MERRSIDAAPRIAVLGYRDQHRRLQCRDQADPVASAGPHERSGLVLGERQGQDAIAECALWWSRVPATGSQAIRDLTGHLSAEEAQ